MREDRIAETARYFGKTIEEMRPLFDNSLERLVSAWPGAEKRYEFYKADYYLIRMMNGTLEERILPELRQLIDSRRGKLLDYGCGVGDVLIYAAERGWEVEGVDVMGETTKFCQWRLDQRHIPAKLYLVNAVSEYPVLPVSYYDLVVSNATIEHLADPQRALDLIRQSKKPNAKEYIFIDHSAEIDHIANLEGII